MFFLWKFQIKIARVYEKRHQSRKGQHFNKPFQTEAKIT